VLCEVREPLWLFAGKPLGVTGLINPKVLKIIVDGFKKKMLIIRTKFRDTDGASLFPGNGTARSPISRNCLT
jgi:hypothetical protein